MRLRYAVGGGAVAAGFALAIASGAASGDSSPKPLPLRAATEEIRTDQVIIPKGFPTDQVPDIAAAERSRRPDASIVGTPLDDRKLMPRPAVTGP